jgi:hypothetical protein
MARARSQVMHYMASHSPANGDAFCHRRLLHSKGRVESLTVTPTVLQAGGEGTIHKEIALLEYGTSTPLENGMWKGFKALSDQPASGL